MGYCHAQMVEQSGQLAVEFNAGLGYIRVGEAAKLAAWLIEGEVCGAVWVLQMTVCKGA